MSDQPIRVLWTSNIDLPEVANELGLKPTPFGGWLSVTTSQLQKVSNLKIGIAMRSDSLEFKKIEKGGVVYFALPQAAGRFDVAQDDVDYVLRDFKPDIVHVEGAEMPHSLRFLSTWKGPRLLSMQGVLNGIKHYELGALPIARMLVPTSPRLFIVAIALLVNYWKNFIPRLASERKAMKMTDHIMGRTLWDQAQASVLAPDARYFKCSRVLRSVFYEQRWSFHNKEEFSIFMGNAATPLKGAHVAIEAISILAQSFPNVKLYIAGEDPRKINKYAIKRYVGYPVYLLNLIHKFGLEDYVIFTGTLSASKIAERMAASHVCLVASIIENSPNTLGEAMILGVPVVSAYTGGAPSMAVDEKEALFYRPEDPVMLAFQVRRVFEEKNLAIMLSENGRTRALENHDPQKNIDMLISVYNLIVFGNEELPR